jgi:transposase
VRELVPEHPVLVAIIEPLLTVWQTLREQVADLDRQVRMRVREDVAARRLMTAPGVGAVVALAYTAVIDDPARFAKSASVGAYLGLTPRRYQSGEVDYDGHISRCGDGLLRSYLYEAANVVLSRLTKPSWLKEWGEALAKRIGARKAKVAVARKLAVVLHRMWMDQQEFRWSRKAAA